MMSHIGQQIIATPILSNISRSKDNQKMQFGQSIEYNMIHKCFSWKIIHKFGEDASLKPYYENYWAYLHIENQNKKRKKWRYVCRIFGITQRFNIEDTKERSQIRVMEVKTVTYGETLRRQSHFIFRFYSPVFTDLY